MQREEIEISEVGNQRYQAQQPLKFVDVRRGQRRATSVCGSGKSLTIMLGGYPDTTTKTLNTEAQG